MMMLDGNKNAAAIHETRALPVKVLQFGEGNFLRGFVDWMLYRSNRKGLFNGSVAVTQPRPSGKPHIDQLKAQQGLYTLFVRGLQEGRKVEEKEVVSVFSHMINPYEEWETFLALAESPDLEFVVSNTTEAGLSYQTAEWNPHEPAASFPAKLTLFLYRRFEVFAGDTSRGLIHLPCELVERNGDRLLEIVLRHAEDWQLPEEFKQWVADSNRFLNTLVDRIVTGYPRSEADELFAEWGYSDPLLTTAEPYYFWAIQAEEELEERLPLARAGLNVRWVKDLAPYQLRKVRILNGAHTMMAMIGLANGLSEVREAVEHRAWGPLFIRGLMDEILPGLPLPTAEMEVYANETLERFRNPYINHRLTDIAMNSLSKWKTRLLPSVKAYIQQTGETPPLLTQSLASLLWLYRPQYECKETRQTEATSFQPKDDEAMVAAIQESWNLALNGTTDSLMGAVETMLSTKSIWGEDLTELPGLAAAVAHHLVNGEGLQS